MVKLEMLVDGLPDFGTDHPEVDFTAIAAGCGIPAVRVQKPAEVRGALAEALSRPGPALVELITDPNALSIPPKITVAQVRGFALAAGRTSWTEAWARCSTWPAATCATSPPLTETDRPVTG